MRSAPLIALLALAAATRAEAQQFQIDGSFPYAFHGWNKTGFSVDAGEFFAGHNFLGLEWNYFNPTPTNVIPGAGAVSTAQRIETGQIVYRFSFPVPGFAKAGDAYPLEIYLGIGAGLGRVRETLASSALTVSVFGTQLTADNTELTCEGVFGLQYNIGPHFGVKAGFRYIDSFNNVKQFGLDDNTDTKTLEIGAVVRF